MGSRTPAQPQADNVERQFGNEAELYAEVRADTAKAMGLDDEADAWAKVQAEIGREGNSTNPEKENDDGSE